MTIFEDLPINFTNHFIKALESHESSFFIEGSLSEESLSALISGIHSKNIGLQHLIVVENSKVAKKIAKCFQFFNPSLNVQLLFGFDISAYSNLYPNKKLIAQRLGWMHQAQNGSTQTIFIATIEGLTQKTIPFSILHKHTSLFKIGSDFFEHPHKELIKLGYIPSPVVEDIGTFSIRGGLIDIFSPAHKHPIRIELFADEIHSLREFDESTQRTLNNLNTCAIIPAQETVLESDYYLHALDKYQADLKHRSEFVKEFPTDYLRQLSQGHYFQGQEFLVSYFYKEAVSALDHFSSNLNIWHFNPMAITQHLDLFLENLKIEHDNSLDLPICPKPEDQYVVLKELTPPPDTKDIYFSKVHVLDHVEEKSTYSFPCSPLIEIRQKFHNLLKDPNDHSDYLKEKLIDFKNKNFSVFIISSSERQTQKIKLLLDDQNFQVEVSDSTNFQWENWINEQNQNLLKINLIHGQIPEGFNLNAERIIFITDDDILGKRRTYKTSATETLSEKAHALSFGELKIDDLIVHKLHGVGIYKGLKTMPIAGIESEFIQIEYKDSDKLYLPIYQIGQIQKYSGPKASQLLNKLGGNGWEKTKVKVKSKIHDLAAELLKLYAARSQLTRAPYSEPDRDFQLFEKEFPYEETPGQQKAIDDVLKNLCSDKPMDRLICGDVGFGKTEVAMRACFKIIQDKKQVAVIAPTTILTFQHFQNFKKRFKNWPIKIAVLNRFVKPKEIRQNIQEIKDGQIDLVIGTHRLFSKDIQFKDLGLLVIDEEQRFGVKHKEQIRQIGRASCRERV